VIAGNRHLPPQRQHVGDQAHLRDDVGLDGLLDGMRLGLAQDFRQGGKGMREEGDGILHGGSCACRRQQMRVWLAKARGQNTHAILAWLHQRRAAPPSAAITRRAKPAFAAKCRLKQEAKQIAPKGLGNPPRSEAGVNALITHANGC
jgi:hypothetical protein